VVTEAAQDGKLAFHKKVKVMSLKISEARRKLHYHIGRDERRLLK